jgi:hypothetical protein
MVLKIKESLQRCLASFVNKSELLITTHRKSEAFDELLILVLDCCEAKHIWQADSHSQTFDISAGNGLYFIVIESSGLRQTQKLIIH